MRLATALRVRPGASIAFTGAGGKSTAIGRLADELTGELPVLISVTTKIARGQASLAAEHLILERDDSAAGDLAAWLSSSESLLITGPLNSEGTKWTGLSRQRLADVRRQLADIDGVMLIEADGARGRSLKAPAEHEPQIPDFVDLVVPVVGLDAIGARLSSEVVHRHEGASALLGVELGEPITVEHVASLLRSSRGSLKGVPDGARVRVLVNKVDRQEHQRAAVSLAESTLASERIASVVLAGLRAEPPVKRVVDRAAGVVLAAGGSSRLGTTKQLLDWGGRTLVEHAVQAALSGGLSPVVVVVGEAADRVRQAVKSHPVEIVENADWEQGQSTSLRAGLAAVADRAEAVVFLLADMPLVGADLVRALVDAHQETLAPIVAPYVGGRSGNPVLFDAITFEALGEIEGDQGGRALFDRFQLHHLAWDESAQFDLDTPEDLARLKQRGSSRPGW